MTAAKSFMYVIPGEAASAAQTRDPWVLKRQDGSRIFPQLSPSFRWGFGCDGLRL